MFDDEINRLPERIVRRSVTISAVLDFSVKVRCMCIDVSIILVVPILINGFYFGIVHVDCRVVRHIIGPRVAFLYIRAYIMIIGMKELLANIQPPLGLSITQSDGRRIDRIDDARAEARSVFY